MTIAKDLENLQSEPFFGFPSCPKASFQAHSRKNGSYSLAPVIVVRALKTKKEREPLAVVTRVSSIARE